MNIPFASSHASRTELGSYCDRRGFLSAAATISLAFTLPCPSFAAAWKLGKPVRLGLIADLHHDVMHDGAVRMQAFVDHVKATELDAILQLGDFAYPNDTNKPVIDRFNEAHPMSLHVIGNHDTDSGHTTQQCLDAWGMPARFYSQNISGVQLLILDGNDQGSPTHNGGYPSYIGEEQIAWLKVQLDQIDGPIIVVSHQPLAGPWAVDNAEQIQTVLESAADRILIAINGHSHIDSLIRVKNVTYLHVNSASYQWVGGKYIHESYSAKIHAKYPFISYTCPYRDPIFATLTIDPETMTIRIEGRQSEWVGKSPAELGVDLAPNLIPGEEVAARIRDRIVARISR